MIETVINYILISTSPDCMTRMKEYITKDQRTYTIEPPSTEDAAELIGYSKLIFASTDQVLNTVDEYTMTVDREIEWINNLNNGTNSLVLIARLDKTIVGLLFFMPNSKRKNAHTGEFGVNVHPDFQGLGIGEHLVNRLLQWARQNEQIEKVILQVFATNSKAVGLYKKMGFIEEGRHKKAIKQIDGAYVDILQMYIETK